MAALATGGGRAVAADVVAPDPLAPDQAAVLMSPEPIGPPAVFDRRAYVSVYGTQWIETHLPLLPYNAVRGRLDPRDSYLVGLGVGYVILQDFDIPLPGTGVALSGFDLEVEGQVAKHFGFQEHVEGTLALMLRTGDIPLFAGLMVNFAAGDGLSYAFGDPKYEQGGRGNRGEDTYRLQNFIALEAEFRHQDAPNVSVVGRLHHRSGVYGLISPRKTGSNFLGVGLRVSF